MTGMVSNPFSTRHTRPGSIAPLDATGRPVDLDVLLDRLHGFGGTAAIVGPHGSGKSTLLTHLAPRLERDGRRAPRIRLHSSADIPAAWSAIHRAAPGDTVCIDSWECTGRLVGGLLRILARVTGRHLLVTSHHRVGFPELVQCTTSPALLRAIVGGLPEHGVWLGKVIHAEDIDQAFANHGGNLRESLYELYDRFEAAVSPIQCVGGDGSIDHAGPTSIHRKIHESADGFSYVGAPERNLG
jgi:energy-coupling factor transporter ATP-binding protein EcfA2